MRIRSMLMYRTSLGANTTASWVHSHVDQADRLEVKCTTHKCACHREVETKKCKPAYWAHVGNVQADLQADEGGRSAGPTESWRGEVRVFPTDEGGHITGAKLKDVLEAAIHRSLFKKSGLKTRALRLLDRNSKSDLGMRVSLSKRAVANWKGINERFITRAAMDILPTYSRLAKAVHSGEDNKLRKQYTPAGTSEPIIDSVGTCPLCGTEPETMSHILLRCNHCPKMVHIRETRRSAADTIASQLGLERWWRDEDWTLRTTGWDPQWGALGQVPSDAWVTASAAGATQEATTKCCKEIQDVMIQSANQLWQRRIELVLDLEEELGVVATKKEYEHYRPQRRPGDPVPKRGRPPLDEALLAKSTKRHRQRASDKRALELAQPDEGPDRDCLQKQLKKTRLALNKHEDQGTLGPLAAPRVGVDPATKGMGTQKPFVTNATLESATLGIGMRISVRWPDEMGKNAKKWPGTVVALVPNSCGTMDQIIRYDSQPDEHYRHALWAGLTKYHKIQSAPCMPDQEDSCQQSQGACLCSANPDPHHHPWYVKDTSTRTTCECAFCVAGDLGQQRLITTAREAGMELPPGRKYHRGPRDVLKPKNSAQKKLNHLNAQIAARTLRDERDAAQAEGNRARSARRAKRARGDRDCLGGSDQADIAEGPDKDATKDSDGSVRRDRRRTGEAEEVGRADDHGPGPTGQERLGLLRDSAQRPCLGSRGEGEEVDQRQDIIGKSGDGGTGTRSEQEATQKGGGLPGRPDGGDQGPPQRHGTCRPAHPGEPVHGGTELVFGGAERRGTGSSFEPRHHPYRHTSRLPTRRGTRLRLGGPDAGKHGPQAGPEDTHDPMGSRQGGHRPIHDDFGRCGNTVPHLDSLGRHPQALGTQLPHKVRQTEPPKSREAQGGSRATSPGEEHCVVSFRMDLPGSIYGDTAILLVREWSMGASWRPGFHVSPSSAEGSQLLHVQGSTSKRRKVSGPERHQHLDEPPGMDASQMRPQEARGNHRRPIGQEAEAARHDFLGDEALDPGRAAMGPASYPEAQAPRPVVVKPRKLRRKRQPELTSEQIRELLNSAKAERLRNTRHQNRIVTEASQVHGLPLGASPGGGREGGGRWGCRSRARSGVHGLRLE
jgi:hypothetical protein